MNLDVQSLWKWSRCGVDLRCVEKHAPDHDLLTINIRGVNHAGCPVSTTMTKKLNVYNIDQRMQELTGILTSAYEAWSELERTQRRWPEDN